MAVFNGTSGNDFLYPGTTGPDTMNGGGGNDYLDAGPGNDVLNGGDGNDFLYGDQGSDRLNGGRGNDTFDVGANSNAIIIEALNGGNDTIFTLANTTLSGNRANVENAQLFGISNANLTGNGLANNLIGNSGNNRLTLLGGNDTGDGGLGNDTTFGGPGNDLHLIGQTGDRIVEVASGGGTDIVGSSLINVDVGLFSNVENGTLFGSSSLNLFGNGGVNVLIGNSGNNRIDGRGGNDVITLGLGNDTGLGGTGTFNDKIDGQGGDDLITLGAGNDTGIGGDGVDRVNGEGGNDIITLGLGQDTGSGGDGNDRLDGNDGNDTLLLGSGNDTGNGGNGNDRIDGQGGADRLFGNAGNDTLVWNSSVVKIDGGSGTNDTLEVKAGGTFDTRTAGDGQIDNMEKIAMKGGGVAIMDSVRLGMLFEGTLPVDIAGTSTDSVRSDEFWHFQGIDGTRAMYERSGVSINVDTDINRTGLATLHVSSLDGANGIRLNGDAAGDEAGTAVGVTDLNGDGIDDVLVGAPQHDNLYFFSAGVGYTVFGDARAALDAAHGSGGIQLSALDGSLGVIFQGTVAGNQVGGSIGGGADINGDGFSEFLVGTRYGDFSGSNAGAGYVVFGSESPVNLDLDDLDGTNGLLSFGSLAGDLLGTIVAGGPDMSGDGIDDFLVTAPGANAAYAVFGGPTSALSPFHEASGFTLNGTDGFQISDGEQNDSIGRSAAIADFNNDGISDIALTLSVGGKNGFGIVFGGHGASEINTSTLNGTNGFLFVGDVDSTMPGGINLAKGDVDGDGITDVIFTQTNMESNGGGNGLGVIRGGDAAHWITLFGDSGGTTAGLDGTNGFFGHDTTFGGGVSVASGDINGDGGSDIIVGVPGAFSGPSGPAGEVKVFLTGSDDFFSVMNGQSNLGGLLNGQYGLSVVGSPGNRAGYSVQTGNIDNDGFDDVVIGAPAPGTGTPGSAFVVFGDNFNNAVNFVGGGDMPLATANGQSYVGSSGSDTANGGVFTNISYRMGGGDDVVISDGFFRFLDGGAGVDTWVMSGPLTDLSVPLEIRNLEAMDLHPEVVELTIGLLQLFGIAETTDFLRIDGDASDSVTVTGAGWESFDAGGGFTGYTTPELPNFLLKIQDTIGTVDIPPLIE